MKYHKKRSNKFLCIAMTINLLLTCFNKPSSHLSPAVSSMWDLTQEQDVNNYPGQVSAYPFIFLLLIFCLVERMSGKKKWKRDWKKKQHLNNRQKAESLRAAKNGMNTLGRDEVHIRKLSKGITYSKIKRLSITST